MDSRMEPSTGRRCDDMVIEHVIAREYIGFMYVRSSKVLLK